MSRGLSLLVATGFSICGASAIAAMEDVATAVALATVFGTLSMLLLPVIGGELGMSEVDFGRIAGSSVHEVAQVVAAASPMGGAAVATAIVVKLSRVVLLAPVVAIASVVRRRNTVAAGGKRPPLMPLFVVGFLVAVAVRSAGVLPLPVLDGAQEVTAVLLTAALFALGSAVRVKGLVRTGPRAFVLGTLSTALVTGTGFAGMLMLT